MTVKNIASFVGKSINDDSIHQRVVRILASPHSPISREHYSVGMSAIPSGHVHEEHAHEHNRELIVVLQGSGKGVIAGETFTVSAGSVIAIEPGEAHTFSNTGDEDLQLLWIYDPPGAEARFLD